MPPLQFLVSMPDREPEPEILVGGSMVVATIRVLVMQELCIVLPSC